MHKQKTYGWTWTERIEAEQVCLTQEKFIAEVEWKDPEMISYFGSSTPHSKHALLHYLAPQGSSREYPVLLIHGAAHSASQSWMGKFGIAEVLSHLGREVYALTFAHPHGDNRLQAVQIANAVEHILEISQAEQIDLIAHSKGGIAVWTYLADNSHAFSHPIHQCFLLGTPLKGLDYPFRHILPNWLVKWMGISAPLACDSMLFYGRYIDTLPYSLYKEGGSFPGSSQLLYRWDDQYPVRLQSKTLYDGGQDLWIHSRGIDKAIEDGNHYMQTLLKTPIDESISVHLLAGSSPVIRGFVTEWDGRSDGLVFVDSALCSKGIVGSEQQIKRKSVLPLNHLELLYHPMAHQWIVEGLMNNVKRIH